MYVVLGATGNTGSIIANSLLTKGERVRVVGRDASRLARFVRKGAEAFTANVTDAAALTKALSGARAAYLMLPPSLTSLDYRADQERESDSIPKAVRESDLRYAVLLSSFGAHVPEGTARLDMVSRQLARDVPRHAVVGWDLVQDPMIGTGLGSRDHHLEAILGQAEVGVERVQHLGGVPNRQEHFRHGAFLGRLRPRLPGKSWRGHGTPLV